MLLFIEINLCILINLILRITATPMKRKVEEIFRFGCSFAVVYWRTQEGGGAE